VETYYLNGSFYEKKESSLFLVGLAASTLTEFVAIGKVQGQTSCLKLFRHRLRSE